MKKFLIAAVAAALLSVASEAPASQSPSQIAVVPQPVAVTAEIDTIAGRRGPVRGIFGRLFELERRKNAWLRRTFLNG